MRLAVVTGASRGIGAAVARALAADAWRVIGIARSDASLRSEAATWPQCSGPSAHEGIACDVRDATTNARLGEVLRDAAAARTPVCFVYAAGITYNALAARMDDADVSRVLSVNLISAISLSRLAATTMLASRAGGSMVFIGSVVADGNVGQAAYAASKAGLRGLAFSLAKELGPRNIRANVVEPGFIATDMTRAHMDAQKLQATLQTACALRRIGTPEEVAHAVRFLVSDSASYITGQVLRVCGGLRV